MILKSLLLLAILVLTLIPFVFSEEAAVSEPPKSIPDESAIPPKPEAVAPVPLPILDDGNDEALKAEREAFESVQTKNLSQIRKMTEKIQDLEISGIGPERIPNLRQELRSLHQERVELLKSEADLEQREGIRRRRMRAEKNQK